MTLINSQVILKVELNFVNLKFVVHKWTVINLDDVFLFV